VDQSPLDDDEMVIGVRVGGDVRCFPLRQMTYHHLVNDTIGGEAVAVTYCVMANTATTIRRESPDETFCVGGLYGGVLMLRRSDTNDVFPQIATHSAVPDNPTSRTLQSGPPSVLTTYAAWKAKHPDTLVLAPVEQFMLQYEAYDKRPTKSAYVNNMLMNETVVRWDERLEPGTEVFGLATATDACAVPLATLRDVGTMRVRLDGEIQHVRWDAELKTPEPITTEGVTSMRAFWYAWSSFYPHTRIYEKEVASHLMK
jgi:hypothetical protein